jgi:elongation factor P
MFDTSDFRNGLKIEIDNTPFEIVEFLHVKPGKGGAFVRTKLKNLQTGAVLSKTFRSGEKVGKPDLVERHMQYLYSQGDSRVFMDLESFEQFEISEKQVGDNSKFLKEDMEVDVLYYKGQPIAIQLPIFVNLLVTHAEPGLKGDTASGGTKPVTLETGAVIQVPLFINEGELLKIDTRTGSYIERVKS